MKKKGDDPMADYGLARVQGETAAANNDSANPYAPGTSHAKAWQDGHDSERYLQQIVQITDNIGADYAKTREPD